MVLTLLFNSLEAYSADAPRASDDAERRLEVPERALPLDWSFQLGVAYITRHNIGELLAGNTSAAKGDAGGEIYNLGVNWVAHRFAIPFWEKTLRPQFEPYVRLTLADENGRSSPFLDYNAGVGFRWVDFPWNRWVKTSFFTGVGFSYSSKVFSIDRIRHPNEDRSHLKLDWPLQLTFAAPRWPEHQIFLFNDHQSGGRIFDAGGVNSLGLGYRLEF